MPSLLHRVLLAAAASSLLSAVASASGDPCFCLADLNHTGEVDGADLGILLAGWGGAGEPDFDGSGVTDGGDLGTLLAAWGPCLAPANDSCASAEQLAGATLDHVFCNVGATGNDSFPACGNDGVTSILDDVWYRWTAVHDGLLHLDTCFDTSLDTVLAVYGSTFTNGCACPGGQFPFASLLACEDDSCELQSSFELPVVAGKCYTFRLGTFSGLQGDGLLHLRNIKVGDRCDVAHELPSVSFQTVEGTNSGDTWIGADESSCAFNDRVDEWYHFVMPCQGTLDITTCGLGTDLDTVLAVYSSCDVADFMCNDDMPQGSCDFAPIGDKASQLSLALDGGEDVYIRVSGYSMGTGNFELTLDVDCIN